MISIYYPNFLLDKSVRKEIFPLLKAYIKPDSFLEKERQQIYNIAPNEYTFVESIEEASLGILPMSWNFYLKHRMKDEVLKFLSDCTQKEKYVMTFMTGDYGVKIPNIDAKNVLVLRQSSNKSKHGRNHIAFPVVIRDPLKLLQDDKLVLRDYTQVPTIGFCGEITKHNKKRVHELMKITGRNFLSFTGFGNYDRQTLISSSYLRGRILSIIENSSVLNDNFIYRSKYRAGAKNQDDKILTKIEFLNNIKDSDYTVCVRGQGNFSVRFYETLAMGRIPVFINTDCFLPLEESLDWKKHVVWIEHDELEHLEQRIVEFHKKYTFESFRKLQEENRLLWQNKLTLGGYFRTLFSSYNIA